MPVEGSWLGGVGTAGPLLSAVLSAGGAVFRLGSATAGSLDCGTLGEAGFVGVAVGEVSAGTATVGFVGDGAGLEGSGFAGDGAVVGDVVGEGEPVGFVGDGIAVGGVVVGGAAVGFAGDFVGVAILVGTATGDFVGDGETVGFG